MAGALVTIVLSTSFKRRRRTHDVTRNSIVNKKARRCRRDGFSPHPTFMTSKLTAAQSVLVELVLLSNIARTTSLEIHHLSGLRVVKALLLTIVSIEPFSLPLTTAQSCHQGNKFKDCFPVTATSCCCNAVVVIRYPVTGGW